MPAFVLIGYDFEYLGNVLVRLSNNRVYEEIGHKFKFGVAAFFVRAKLVIQDEQLVLTLVEFG